MTVDEPAGLRELREQVNWLLAVVCDQQHRIEELERRDDSSK
jgi:hypothetical protein